MSLALITSHFRTRMRKEESNPSNKSANEHEHILSQVTRWLEWIWNLERLWTFDLCLGVNALALVLNEHFRRLGYLELWWLGVFIALNHQVAFGKSAGDGRTGQSGAPPTGPVHCPVRHHVTQPLGSGARSTVGGFVLMRHRTVRCHTGQVMFTIRCASDSAALTLRALFLC
jgi:hypothetical protein